VGRHGPSQCGTPGDTAPACDPKAVTVAAYDPVQPLRLIDPNNELPLIPGDPTLLYITFIDQVCALTIQLTVTNCVAVALVLPTH